MSSPIRVGFIGLSATGWAANALGPSLFQPSLKDKYSLVAVSTTSEASAKASVEKYTEPAGHPLKAYHGSSSKIASDPDIDLVVVSVKAPLHKEVVIPVIEAKKKFFLEWPAGATTEETKAIAQAANAHGVKSFIGLQARGSPIVRKVKELVDAGAIGRVLSSHFIGSSAREMRFWPPEITSKSLYAQKEGSGASFFTIAGGHQLDAFTYALGHFKKVSALTTIKYPVATVLDDAGKPQETFPNTTIRDHYSISGELTNGTFVTMVWYSGYKTTKGRRNLLWEINGEDGIIRIEGDSPYINVLNPSLYLNGEKVEVEGVESQTLGILEQAWIEYAKGDEGKHATIEDAVRLHELIDAIEGSADKEGQVFTFQ